MAMTKLTRTAILTRKLIRYGFFFLIFVISIRFLINTTVRIYRYFFPVPPAPPTVAFGKLPALPFPEKQRPANLNLVLETPDGDLPVFSDQAKVYFMPQVTANLLSLDAAKEKAIKLGFNPEGTQESDTIYVFNHVKVPAKLRVNTVTGVFSISYDLVSDNTPIQKSPSTPEVAKVNIERYLESAGVLPVDFLGETEVEYIKINEGKLEHAISLSEANLVKINFFRQPYDDLPSLTPEPGKGNVWFMAGGSSEKDKIVVAGEFHYFPVDAEKFETYPIKTSQASWEELKTGGGYIASLGGLAKEGATVKIRRVYLAYYDAGVPTEFFQPITVFEGDGGFTAYVPAVSGEYYGSQ